MNQVRPQHELTPPHYVQQVPFNKYSTRIIACGVNIPQQGTIFSEHQSARMRQIKRKGKRISTRSRRLSQEKIISISFSLHFPSYARNLIMEEHKNLLRDDQRHDFFTTGEPPRFQPRPTGRRRRYITCFNVYFILIHILLLCTLIAITYLSVLNPQDSRSLSIFPELQILNHNIKHQHATNDSDRWVYGGPPSGANTIAWLKLLARELFWSCLEDVCKLIFAHSALLQCYGQGTHCCESDGRECGAS